MNKSKLRKSESFYILTLGFSFLISLLTFFAYTSLEQMKISHETIEGSSRASDKMELIVELIETARTRTRLTLEMSYEGDAFIKDDISMSLDKYSLQFRELRQKLIDLDLTENEKEIMLAIDESIIPALSQQRQAAQMALSNDGKDIKKAQEVMIQSVYPLQRKIIDNFMSLLNYQKTIIFESRVKASAQYERAYKLQTTLLIVILLLALMVAFYVIWRSFLIEKELFLEKEKAEITLRSVGDAVITTNKDGMVDYLNPVAEKLTGYITHDIIGKPITEIYKAYDETNERWLADCIMNYLKHGSYTMPSNDIILYDTNDELIDISQTIAPIQDTNDNVLGTITTFQDISKEKVLAKRIEHQAQHDALTGLLNRREFETKVEQSLRLYSEGTTHALCVMDLDRFKIVNDTLGHTAGDELLKQISSKIQHICKKNRFIRSHRRG